MDIKIYYKGKKCKTIIWMLEDITEIHIRRINFQYSAIEIFTKRGKTFLLNLFNERVADKVLSKI